ncbi:hypothetical protein FRB99_003291 [Tulasnella sp. 403]|nr:hypothetical protein FRB99_003291 [Tulasnella sp. 403]
MHNDSGAPKKAKEAVLRASETIPTTTGASQTDAGEPVAIHKKVAFASGKENASAAEAPPLKKKTDNP